MKQEIWISPEMSQFQKLAEIFKHSAIETLWTASVYAPLIKILTETHYANLFPFLVICIFKSFSSNYGLKGHVSY